MPVLTRKVQIIPVGDEKEVDRVYKYIRNGMKTQNLAMNQYISALYMSKVEKISKEDRKELKALYSRISGSKKGSAYSIDDIKFPVGLPTANSLKQKVDSDFSNQMKKGLIHGRVSLINYKLNNPLLIHVDWVRLRSSNPHIDFGTYHNYESHKELVEKLRTGDPEIFIKFANNITFKYVFGNPHKSAFLREEFINIFEENYKINSSSIQFDKTGKKIMLNLSIEIPEKECILDDSIVVGVDLGIAIPAYCSLNINYKGKAIGCKESLLAQRLKIQSEKRRLQRQLASNKGGHGRKRKLEKLDSFKDKERNYVKTYNHYISKNVIDFALKNNAKYINFENLEGIDSDNFILRNWSYYELQQMITYKANLYGIVVRKIKPAYTSQTCSFCGSCDEKNRVSQARFSCHNKECKMYEKEINADYNASRNIAKSVDFV